MTWLEELAELLRAALEGFWALIALGMDLLRDLGALGSGGLLLGLVLILGLTARLMQRRLVRRLREDPDVRVKYLQQEFWFFLPAWPLLPFMFLWRGLKWLGRRLGRLLRRNAPDDQETPKETPEQAPYLVATLGPSFLLGALITAGLYLACRLVEPLLAARYGLTPGSSAWQYLLLGQRPEMAPYLPLGRAPYLAVASATFLWLILWWWVSRGVRLAAWRSLRRNLLRDVENPAVLPVWRQGFGVRRLWRPARAYRAWAVPMVLTAGALGVWAWISLGDPGQGVHPSEMALVLVLLTGWSMHLWLEGERRDAEPEEPETEVQESQPASGWPDVVEDLRRRLQVVIPEPLRPPRPASPPDWSLPLEDDPLFSPLLSEVLPEGSKGLSAMQLTELRRLSHLGHVHLQPPRPPEELGLDASLPGDVLTGSDEAEERNRIVLAPEGWGKTTLALLAAVNHVLVHTRSALILTRDEARAEEIHQRLLRRLRGSGLRWNVRLRRVGDDLVRDLSEGIVPDVVVTSLHRLVCSVLDAQEVHSPLLRSLGLVVVDDVESFAGPVEVHTQLAFRRLTLAARKETGVHQLGERNAPLVLALGSESMHRMSPWIHALLGIEASTMRYPVHHPAPDAERYDEASELGQVFYRLRDFRTASGERLDLFAVVESCERLGVSWHYRLCRDGLRHRGRKVLPLPREPQSFVSEPRRAAVVFLDGAFSEIRRELQRLRRAGIEHAAHPCALLTLGDSDEDMALTQWDDSSSLAELLTELPRPILRAPTGRAIHAHMSSDLVQAWTEVAEVLRTFGNASAHKLRHLAREGLLLTEERTDLPPETHDYEERVFVRSLAAAVEEDDPEREVALPRGTERPLPKKVSQVELASDHWVTVRDRTDLAELRRVETHGADFLYYPGRLFADTQGRYLVVHRASREGEEDREGPARGDVLVEPTLSDDVSSPRYEDRVEVLDLGDGSSAPMEEAHEAAFVGHAFSGPDPVLLGEHPFHVALARVRVMRQHLATLRLGPVFGEVRQRRIFDAASRRRFGPARLDTVALALFPNPESSSDAAGAVPVLQLEPARLLAAALRLVLPSLVRRASDSLAVTLKIGDQPEEISTPESPPEGWVAEHGPGIQPEGGLFLFDLATWGNGTARALHRDGLESLLRMARLVIERVLYHDRLRAFHDHWATGEDPSGRYLPPELGQRSLEPEERLEAMRRWDRGVREAALTWLDSRLRPEGTPAVTADSLGRYGSGDEEGEGDLIDIGRCWYTRDDLVTDLLWAKHRWRRNPVQEVMLDLAFDRRTAEIARYLRLESPLLQRGVDFHRRMLDKDRELPDGTPWGAPRGVWFQPEEDEEEAPRVSQVREEEQSLEMQRRAFALAKHGWPLVQPLVARMREELFAEASAEVPEGRYAVARDLARFVQGMTPLAPDAEDRPAGAAWTVVDTLLLRRGDLEAKGLLLALLLRRCGIESGLFVSFAEGRVLAGAALPAPATLAAQSFRVQRDEEGRFASEDDAVGEEETYQRPSSKKAREQQERLHAWAEEVGLPRAPGMWAESPRAFEDGDRVDLYVPIETVSYGPVGLTWRHQPESWIFLPLSGLWRTLDPPVASSETPESSEDGTDREDDAS